MFIKVYVLTLFRTLKVVSMNQRDRDVCFVRLLRSGGIQQPDSVSLQ